MIVYLPISTPRNEALFSLNSIYKLFLKVNYYLVLLLLSVVFVPQAVGYDLPPKTDPLYKLVWCFRKYGLYRQRYLVFVCVYQVPMNKIINPDTNKKNLAIST